MAAVREVFQRFREASGLELKVSKCVLLPLMRAATDEATVQMYRDLLRAAVPEWAGFRVELQAVYLGMPVGVNVTPSDRWAKPLAKFKDRVAALSRSTMSPAAVLRGAKMYAVAVLPYVGMAARAVDEVGRAEALMWQRALRLPLKALPLGAHGHMAALGLVRMPLLREFLAGVLARSARRHAADVAAAGAELQRWREAVGTLAALACPHLAPDRRVWNAPAQADEMAEALKECAEERVPPPTGCRGSAEARRADALELARALLPRVRKWFPNAGATDDEVVRKMTAAILPLRRCSPLHGVALVRAWCDGWKTAGRRGFVPGICIVCGRRDADTTKHMLRCPRLWQAVQRVSELEPPRSMAAALALTWSETLGPRRPSGRAAPPSNVMRLTLASDVFHKLKSRCNEERPRRHPFSAATVAATAKNAWRRIGAL